MSIQLLDKNTINKNAAGEVIERPASVVKELTENSIDAGATIINVEIQEGGTSYIRVTDNGSGISPDDIKNAFLKHATSKIREIDDLENVMTLGFRGEALSSIASVSKVELRTKTSGTNEGLEYIIEGGEEKKNREAGAPDGTSVIVKDLFFNTPVRKKFLRSSSAEAAAVYTVMEHFAISRPDISFRLLNNGREKLHTTGSGRLKEVIYNLYGRDITSNLIEITAKNADVQISGYIGKPAISRGNRGFENYSVNGRYIKNDSITAAIEDAFKGYIMLHNYPFTALNLTIDPKLLDVNVHPAKREFRLTASDEVCIFVRDSIREAIEGKNVIPDIKPGKTQETVSVNGDEIESKVNTKTESEQEISARFNKSENYLYHSLKDKGLLEEDVTEYKTSKTMSEDDKNGYRENSPADRRFLKDGIYMAEGSAPDNDEMPSLRRDIHLQKPADSENAAGVQETFEQEEIHETNDINKFRLIGQLFSTYWLIESDDTFYMMDQHAAHEKVLYERIMERIRNKTPQTQYLTVPHVVDMDPVTVSLLEENESLADSFRCLGYEAELFGDNALKVTGVPAGLPAVDQRQMITDVVDGISSKLDTGIQVSDTPQIIIEKLASMSCKAAIKGNDRISAAEALELLEEMMNADNPYNCPHGRPTLVAMSKYDIEKMFKRIV